MPFNSFDDYPMSWRPDRESLGKPYYVGLVDLLEESVRAGELPAGTTLPPQRELADFLDLNPSTVARAYALARERGLVYGVTGKGTFVAPHAQSDLTITAEGAGGLVELGMVTGFNQCDGLVADAVRAVAQRGYLSRLMDYSNPCGFPHHLEAGRRWLAWKGLRREPDCVVVTSGVQNALVVTLCALFRAGDRIAVDAYTFANFIELAKMMGIELVPVAGDADGMRDAALDALCRAVDVRGVYLMPSCANPTTVHMPLERRRRVAAVAERHGLVIVEDDFGGTVERLDLELGRPVTPRFADLAPERTVHVAETTKTLANGLRIAFLACPERFRERIEHAVYNVNVKTSSLDAEVVSELILGGGAREIVERKRLLLMEANDLFDRLFPGMPPGFPYPLFRWVPIDLPGRPDEIEARFRAAGVRVYHGDRFRVSGEAKDGFLRVSLSTWESPRRFERGLRALRSVLAAEGGGGGEARVPF